MPFRSEAQRRFLWRRHPEIAKRWAHKYGTPKKLPYHKGGKKAVPRRRKEVSLALRLKAMSTDGKLRAVREAFNKQFNNSSNGMMSESSPYCWVKETYLDEGYLIVESHEAFHRVNFSKKDGEYTFDDRSDWTEVEQTYVTKEGRLFPMIVFKHPGHSPQKVHGGRLGRAIGRVRATAHRANLARLRFRRSRGARAVSLVGNAALLAGLGGIGGIAGAAAKIAAGKLIAPAAGQLATATYEGVFGKPQGKETMQTITFKHPGHSNQKVHGGRGGRLAPTKLPSRSSRLRAILGSPRARRLGVAALRTGGLLGVAALSHYLTRRSANQELYSQFAAAMRRGVTKERLAATFKHPGHANQKVHGRRGGGKRAVSAPKKIQPAKRLSRARKVGEFLNSPAGRMLLGAALQHGPGLIASGARGAGAAGRRLGQSEFADVVRGGGQQGGFRYRINRRATMASWFRERQVSRTSLKGFSAGLWGNG